MIRFARKGFVFLKRDLLESLSYKTAFVFDVLSIVARLVPFFFITKLIGAGADEYLKESGGDYFAFVLTGLAFSGCAAAALTSFASAVMAEQSTGTLEAILVTPTSLWTVIGASFVWTLLTSLVQAVVYLLVGALLFHAAFPRMNVWAALVFLVLTIVALSGPGLLSAAFALAFKRGDPVSYVFNAASRFLAGVYFPVALLPVGLQKLSGFVPLTYSLKALRAAVMEGQGLAQLRTELLVLGLFSVLLLPLSVVVFNAATSYARRKGSLSFV